MLLLNTIINNKNVLHNKNGIKHMVLCLSKYLTIFNFIYVKSKYKAQCLCFNKSHNNEDDKKINLRKHSTETANTVI